MIKIDTEKVVKGLIETFLNAGKISIKLREKGLVKKIKLDTVEENIDGNRDSHSNRDKTSL